MNLKLIICIIFLLLINALSLYTFAQNETELLTLKGHVYDKQTQKAVYFASVKIQGTDISTITNFNGYFTLHYPVDKQNDSLLISSVAYDSYSLALNAINHQDTLKIALQSAIYTLDEVTVIAYSATQILEKAVAKLSKNTPQESFVMAAFYRQYHKENERYVRLIEADLNIYDKGYAKRFAQNRFRINALRRSKVYERNGAEHGDHLKELLEMNVVKHRYQCILSRRGAKWYNLTVEGVHKYQNQWTYCIHFQAKKEWGGAVEAGLLWIRKSDFAILCIEIETKMTDLSLPARSWNISSIDMDSRYDWKKQTQRLHLRFKEKEGKLYPAEMIFHYQHKLYDSFNQKMRFIVDEYFELYVYEIKKVPDDLKKYKFFGNVYRKKYDYNTLFWESYLPLLNHPLPAMIQQDLENKLSLEEQF